MYLFQLNPYKYNPEEEIEESFHEKKFNEFIERDTEGSCTSQSTLLELAHFLKVDEILEKEIESRKSVQPDIETVLKDLIEEIESEIRSGDENLGVGKGYSEAGQNPSIKEVYEVWNEMPVKTNLFNLCLGFLYGQKLPELKKQLAKLQYPQLSITEDLDSNSVGTEATKQTKKVAWLYELGIIDAVLERSKDSNGYNFYKAADILNLLFTDVKKETFRKSIAVIKQHAFNNKNNPLNPTNMKYVQEMKKIYNLD